MRSAQGPDPAGVLDDRLDLAPVADDARVGQKPRLVPGPVAGNPVERESLEGPEERIAALQNNQPGEAGLVDLQRQALQERVVIRQWKAIFALVIGPMEGMPGRDVAIPAHPQGAELSDRKSMMLCATT